MKIQNVSKIFLEEKSLSNRSDPLSSVEDGNNTEKGSKQMPYVPCPLDVLSVT